jgi:hypothetical protein
MQLAHRFGIGPTIVWAAGLVGEAVGLRADVLMGALGMQLGFLILVLSPLRRLRQAAPTQP